MYRIRFHGRGGQGMKTAARILGTAFFLEGYEVQDAPRYGAERRGAPIASYVRADRQSINERGIILNPDLVLVADETLVSSPAAGVVQGLDTETVLVIDSDISSINWCARLNSPGPILTLPVPIHGAEEALPYVGVACAGAAARLVGVVSLEMIEQAIAEELVDLSDAIIKKNIAVAIEAYRQMESHHGIVKERLDKQNTRLQDADWVDLPQDDVGIAGPAVYGAATSVEVKTGLWRTLRPVIDYDRCNRCNWVCGSFCPDSAINVDSRGYPVIDLDHCKGCMICVAQCPPHAIEAVSEQIESEKERVAS